MVCIDPMKFLSILSGVLVTCVLLFLPVLVSSGGFCEGLNPLFCTSRNVVAEVTLPQTASLLLRIIAGLSIVFIVWGGILMLISMGDDTKTAQGKWAIIYALIGLFGAILSQAFVGTVAQAPLTAGATEVSVMQVAVGYLVSAVNIIFFSVIIFAGIRMLLGQGQPEEFNRAKKVITWAIAGAVIVNVARTLVRAVLTLFGV